MWEARTGERPKPQPTIVIGVDGSRNSVVALRWAFLQTSLRSARLVVVLGWEHVPPSTTSQAWTLQGRPRTAESATRVLESTLREVFGSASGGLGSWSAQGVPVTAELREGAPGTVLCEAGRGAELLVIGAAGRHPVKGLLGSVMRHVTTHAECPVAVVRPPAATAPAVPAEPIGV